jgi:hypothetical protein
MVSVTIDEVWIGNRIYWILTFVTTNNYDSLTELHTPKITVTKAHIKSSQSSLVVAWYRLQRRTFPFFWVPELSPASATNFSVLSNVTLNRLKTELLLLVI